MKTKLKRARYPKDTTWLKYRRFKIDGYGTQKIITIGGYHIVIGTSDNTSYIKFGDNGCGINVTTKPRFSHRIGKRKSFKLGKYYISKL
jgi:hypothetical protein